MSIPAYAHQGWFDEPSLDGHSSLSGFDASLYVLHVEESPLFQRILVFQPSSGTFLPLGKFSQSLALGITVDLQNQKASGGAHGFLLDMRLHTVTLAGNSFSYDSGLVVGMPDDIYVEIHLLEDWFQLKIDMDRLCGNVNVKKADPDSSAHSSVSGEAVRSVTGTRTDAGKTSKSLTLDSPEHDVDSNKGRMPVLSLAPTVVDGGDSGTAADVCAAADSHGCHVSGDVNVNRSETPVPAIPLTQPNTLIHASPMKSERPPVEAPESEASIQNVETGNEASSTLAEENIGVRDPLDAGHPFSNDDALLCIVELKRFLLSEALITYISERGLFLPLGELSRLLEFGVNVNPEAQTASGNMAWPGETFHLDAGSATAVIRGRKTVFNAEDVVVMSDDIYIRSQLLAEWFSMHIDADRFNASVSIAPFVPIPLQKRIAREQAGSNTWGYGVAKDSGYPRRKFPYRMLDGASIDVALNSSYAFQPGHRSSPVSTGYSSRVTGDLLWMNAALDFSGQLSGGNSTGEGIDNGALKLGRIDPAGGLLGPLSATNIAFGDLNASSLPLIGSAVKGPGFIVSSYPVPQSQLFDLVTLNGYLAPGWDVQLYRNGTLLDYRPATAEGRYDFVDIPLYYGMNEVELVFNGPQGDQRRETYLYRVGSNMIDPGSWAYQAAVSFPSRQSLFKESQSTTPERQEDQGLRATWRSTVGVSRWLTLSQYLSSSTAVGDRHEYLGSGLSGYLGGMQIDTDIAYDTRQLAGAWQAGLLTEIAGFSLSGRYSAYDCSWVNMDGPSSYSKKIEARMGGLRLPLFPSSASWSIGYERLLNEEEQGSEAWDIAWYLNTFGISNTHNLYINKRWQGSDDISSMSGVSAFTWARGILTLSGSIRYQFMSERFLSSLNVSDRIVLTDDMLLSNSFNYDFLSDSWATNFSLNRLEDFGMMSLTGGYSQNGSWSAGVQMSLNFSRDPLQSRWYVSGRNLSQTGAVSALAYIDSNKNCLKDAGEIGVSDVGFFVNRRDHLARTDSAGCAFLRDIQADVPTDISISAATLTDFSWVPADKGYQVVPRPGMPGRIDFPIWITGEISGIVYRDDGETTQYAPGIVLQVLDKDGHQIKKTVSEYDGFYVISKIPTGPVTLRVSPEQAKRLNVEADSKVIDIPSDGGVIDNFHVIIRPKEVIKEESTSDVSSASGD